MRLPIVGVMGSGREPHGALSSQVGLLLAELGVHLLTGGGQGVMLAVSEAYATAVNRRGMVIGVLPCEKGDPCCRPKHGYPNPYVEIAVATHLPLSGKRGMAAMSRNHINVLSSDAIVALPGGAGTSSEAALAVRYHKPIVAFLGNEGEIPNLEPSIPVVRRIEEVERFLRQTLAK